MSNCPSNGIRVYEQPPLPYAEVGYAHPENRRLHLEVTPANVTYQLRSGEPLQIVHENEPVTVSTQRPVTRALTRRAAVAPATQPCGRAPARRQAKDASS